MTIENNPRVIRAWTEGHDWYKQGVTEQQQSTRDYLKDKGYDTSPLRGTLDARIGEAYGKGIHGEPLD